MTRSELRDRQDRLINLLTQEEPGAAWDLPLWEGGPNLGQLNLDVREEWAPKVEELIRKLEQG